MRLLQLIVWEKFLPWVCLSSIGSEEKAESTNKVKQEIKHDQLVLRNPEKKNQEVAGKVVSELDFKDRDTVSLEKVGSSNHEDFDTGLRGVVERDHDSH